MRTEDQVQDEPCGPTKVRHRTEANHQRSRRSTRLGHQTSLLCDLHPTAPFVAMPGATVVASDRSWPWKLFAPCVLLSEPCPRQPQRSPRGATAAGGRAKKGQITGGLLVSLWLGTLKTEVVRRIGVYSCFVAFGQRATFVNPTCLIVCLG